MIKVFDEVYSLDKRCYDEFLLTEEILMENAGRTISEYIYNHFPKGSSVLIVAGSGNNGADGIVIARQLFGDFQVRLYLASQPKSEIGKRQLQRAKAIGVEIVSELVDSDIVVDALFGTGLKGELPHHRIELIERINSLSGFKIGCDIPSGIDRDGNISSVAVKCDITITMGALKLALLSDIAKEHIGKLEIANLGVSQTIYERETNYFLLEKSDFTPPIRNRKSSHKGDYGHCAVLSGEKKGASILSGMSALIFGAGLVTLVSSDEVGNIPYDLMESREIPRNCSVIVGGMGLGDSGIDHFRTLITSTTLPMVLDADILHSPILKEILEKRPHQLILTPHPREFQSILKNILNIDISVSEIVRNRIDLVQKFSEKYPDVVLLLKGANRVIVYRGKVYFDTLGLQNLAKGGSGDILSGLIGSLLAQGYTPLEASISGSLGLSLASQRYRGSNFSLTPTKLLELLREI